MKRKILVGTLASVFVLGGAFAVGATNNDRSDLVEGTNQSENKMITIEEAKKAALKEVNGKVESVELEGKRDKVLYEVDIEKDHIDYDVYIDAHTGELYSINQDDDFDDDDSTVSGNQTQKNEGTISQSEAINIAEKATNGKMHEIEKDEDDGRIKYEIELKTDRGEAEVEIDAVTGKILEVEFDD